MSHSHLPFEQRLNRLTRKHRRMVNGVVHRIGRDGLISAHPRRRRPSFPLRGVVILLAVAFVFKATLYAVLGGSTYASRVDQLRTGSIVEQAGAWVMQPEPATVWLAGQFDRVLP